MIGTSWSYKISCVTDSKYLIQLLNVTSISLFLGREPLPISKYLNTQGKAGSNERQMNPKIMNEQRKTVYWDTNNSRINYGMIRGYITCGFRDKGYN